MRAYFRAVKYASQIESRVRIMLIGDEESGTKFNIVRAHKHSHSQFLYSREISQGAKFCGFADRSAATKIRTTKISVIY